METTAASRRDEDDRLLRRFVAGESAAHRVVERWAREIVTFRGFGLSLDERDDAVQDVVADVWRAASRHGFELRFGLKALVRTIASARCIDRLRRRRPHAELDESLPDPGPGPYEHALAADDRARLHWALHDLDEACREIIRLHFLEELGYSEIARIEERSEATMRVRMFNCIRAIRRRMVRGGGPE